MRRGGVEYKYEELTDGISIWTVVVNVSDCLAMSGILSLLPISPRFMMDLRVVSLCVVKDGVNCKNRGKCVRWLAEEVLTLQRTSLSRLGA